MAYEKTSEFFLKKREWSIIKDELLAYYLKPYFTKILNAGSLLYIDCFAGAGKFEDGQIGSPLIALNALNEAIKIKQRDCDVTLCFIEAYYQNLLKENISSHHLFKKAKIYGENFKEHILEIIDSNKKRNLFLYIDPFGIKYLSFKIIDEICAIEDISSKEVLINFNSFGFFREACRRKKLTQKKIKELEEFLDADMLEDDELDDNKMLNEIIGSNLWEDIIDKFSHNQISALEAEKMISELFRKRLNKNFQYVLDLPIKNKSKNIPKYRMIFGTNHADGCEIMYDDISKRKEQLAYFYAKGQGSLIPEFNGVEYVNMDKVNKIFYQFLRELVETNISEKRLIAMFCTKAGILCSCKELKNSIKDLEDKKILKVTNSLIKEKKVRFIEKIDKERLQC